MIETVFAKRMFQYHYRIRDRGAELNASTNPFAIVVMAHLKALETRNNRPERQQWKLALTRRLYEGGYDREDVINLFHFIDWLMSLPEDLDRAFWQQVRQMEEEKRMRYVTSVERRAIQQGIEQGIEQEAASLVMRLLRRRFGEIDATLVERVRCLRVDRLEDLGEALFDFESEADLTDWLDSM